MMSLATLGWKRACASARLHPRRDRGRGARRPSAPNAHHVVAPAVDDDVGRVVAMRVGGALAAVAPWPRRPRTASRAAPALSRTAARGDMAERERSVARQAIGRAPASDYRAAARAQPRAPAARERGASAPDRARRAALRGRSAGARARRAAAPSARARRAEARAHARGRACAARSCGARARAPSARSARAARSQLALPRVDAVRVPPGPGRAEQRERAQRADQQRARGLPSSGEAMPSFFSRSNCWPRE